MHLDAAAERASQLHGLIYRGEKLSRSAARVETEIDADSWGATRRLWIELSAETLESSSSRQLVANFERTVGHATSVGSWVEDLPEELVGVQEAIVMLRGLLRAG